MLKLPHGLLVLLMAICLVFGNAVLSGAAGEEGVTYDLKKLKDLSPPEKKGCMQGVCIHFPAASLGFDFIFNTKDLFLGINLEQPLVRNDILDLSATVFFYGRPFEKTSFEQTGPTTYNQYKENRYIMGAKLKEKLWMGDVMGFFGGAGYGYTFGSFRGTDRPTRDHWTPHYFGGAFYSFSKMVCFEGGYQYTKIPHSPDHFIFTSISCSFIAFADAPGGQDGIKKGSDGKKHRRTDKPKDGGEESMP